MCAWHGVTYEFSEIIHAVTLKKVLRTNSYKLLKCDNNIPDVFYISTFNGNVKIQFQSKLIKIKFIARLNIFLHHKQGFVRKILINDL